MVSEKERNKIEKIAQKYAKKGKLPEAIAEYSKLLTGNSMDLNIRSILGDLYVRSNQKDKAVEEFQKIASNYEERGLYSQSIAIYKKINKLNPGDIKSTLKLADLYYNQGFLSEAKKEYMKLAQYFKESNKTKEALRLYEKILKLDDKDIQSRLTLAHLYKQEKLLDQAVEEFNKVAEAKIADNALKEAEEVLNLARELKKDHTRTMSNLIELLRRGNRNKEALGLINGILEKDKEDIKALNLLGNYYFEEKDYGKAEDVYSKIVSLQAKDVEARIMLGRIYINQEKLDEAYKLYEPLIDSLIKRQKVEKAIGLLGLIMKSKVVHIPSLEKLAYVFESADQKKNLEITCRVILEEYHRQNMKKEALTVLSKLVSLCPDDENVKNEYTLLSKEFGPPAEEEKEEPPEEEEIVKTVEVEEEKEEPIEVEEEKEEPIEVEEEKEEIIELEEEKGEEFEAEEKEEEEEEELIKVEDLLREEEVEEVEEKREEAHEVEEEPIEVEELTKEEEERKEPIEEEIKEEPLEILEENKEIIEKNLAQVDSYLEQGLAKSARRILENLRLEYPDEPRIEEKFANLEGNTSQVPAEEIIIEEEGKEAPVEEERREEHSEVTEEAEGGLEANLAQADSFLEQGLVKTARRILENLRIEHPDEPRIEEKLASLEGITSQAPAEKIIKEEKKEAASEVTEEAEEGLEANLAQADLYLEQGLVKTARRILENLRIEHPDEPMIEEKLANLEGMVSQVKEEDIHWRVEKISEKESELLGKKAAGPSPGFPKEEEKERMTSAEVFEEADVTPSVSRKEKKYYELDEKIDEELDVIKTVFNEQLEGKTTVFEKELSDIVAEFTKALEEEVDKEDYESHFNLGIAFLEQGLIDEAIQEIKLASQDEKRAVECYSVLSHCYKQKKDFQEAVEWIEKALELSEENSGQSFDLKYELASLYEALKDTKKALNIYTEIKKWNAEYREVAERIEKLKKT